MGAHLAEAQELGHQLMRLAEESADEGLLLEAYRAEGVNLYHLGQFVPARASLEAGLALYDFERHRSHAYQYGHDPAISCLAYLAHTLFVIGDAEQANDCIRELLRLAWRLAHPFTLCYSMAFGAATACQYQRDVAGTLRWSEQGLALAERRGFPFWEATSTILGGWALAMQGKGPDAVDMIRNGLSLWQYTGSAGILPYYYCLLAEACALNDDSEGGLTAVSQGLAATHATGERFYESELHRMRGELMLLRDSGDAATQAFELALSIARRQGARAFEERALASLDRL
jgi:predicted ATPase